MDMRNPRTGATRRVATAWYFAGSAPAHLLTIRRVTIVPSCTYASIGTKSGAGVLLRALDPTPILTGSQDHSEPAAFAVQFR
jgi:hypothetical protein